MCKCVSRMSKEGQEKKTKPWPPSVVHIVPDMDVRFKFNSIPKKKTVGGNVKNGVNKKANSVTICGDATGRAK